MHLQKGSSQRLKWQFDEPAPGKELFINEAFGNYQQQARLQYFVYAQTLAFDLPAHGLSRIDAPSFWGKHDIIETGDPFLVQFPNPGNFSIR